MTHKFPTIQLPANGSLDLQIEHLDIIAVNGVPYGRVKGKTPDGSLLQFREPWVRLLTALTENGVVNRASVPRLEGARFKEPRDYINVPFDHAHVTFTTRTVSGATLIEVVPRSAPTIDLKTTAAEVADAAREGIAAFLPVFDGHGITVTAADAILIGSAVLEHRERIRRRAS